MKIKWRDTDLQEHKLALDNIVDITINGITISEVKGEGLRVDTNDTMQITPSGSSAINIKRAK